MFDINLAMLSSEVPINNLSSYIDKNTLINDPLLIPHLTNILNNINNNKVNSDIIHISNVVKQTQIRQDKKVQREQKGEGFRVNRMILNKNREFVMNNFKNQVDKIKWAGYSLTKEEIVSVGEQLIWLGEKNKLKQVRFWGKINGTKLDYYIIQGLPSEIKHDLTDLPKGAQKNGQGINYYTFWVTNNLLKPQWTQLPMINPQHIKTSRKIKKYFTGYLQQPIFSYPQFKGTEKHYLKAQLVRMTSSLQIAPKGIYKVHDQNPKIIQYQQQPKVPEFAELITHQTWIHKNQNVLNLGRCTHFVDPSLPQDQIQAVTAELAQKDPQIQRLRGITQDKLPQGSPFGVENIWQIKTVGDTQVFQKDQGTFVYGIVILKNLYWPGWVSIGYKNGYTNYYTGYGLKWTQGGWNQYQNSNLGQQSQDTIQYREPNPVQQPKPVVEVVQQQPPQQ